MVLLRRHFASAPVEGPGFGTLSPVPLLAGPVASRAICLLPSHRHWFGTVSPVALSTQSPNLHLLRSPPGPSGLGEEPPPWTPGPCLWPAPALRLCHRPLQSTRPSNPALALLLALAVPPDFRRTHLVPVRAHSSPALRWFSIAPTPLHRHSPLSLPTYRLAGMRQGEKIKNKLGENSLCRRQVSEVSRDCKHPKAFEVQGTEIFEQFEYRAAFELQGKCWLLGCTSSANPVRVFNGGGARGRHSSSFGSQ